MYRNKSTIIYNFLQNSSCKDQNSVFPLFLGEQRPLWDYVATLLNKNCDTNYVSYSIINIFVFIICKKNYPALSLYAVI